MYGGALPAILVNTPGTAANALTTYDGYPMTQQGAGRRAVSGLLSVVCGRNHQYRLFDFVFTRTRPHRTDVR